jgi:glycosyltransferase involved in cell wall biosynthesis
MKVLMLGWEYPPHIAGGLGTACEGLTKALAEQGVSIHFVVPKMFGDEQVDHMLFSQVAQPLHVVSPKSKQATTENLEKSEIPAFLSPYWSPSQFKQAVETVTRREWSVTPPSSKDDKVAKALIDGDVYGVELASALSEFSSQERTAQRAVSDRYASDIFSEVERFTARVLARFRFADFDVIHAHDWMTFPAAVALAQTTKRPLVVHVHSLEHDRSGVFHDETIDKIERFGIKAADRVIAVSHYTKRSIESRHFISSQLISVVHNGVYPRQVVSEYRHKKTWPKNVVLFLGRVTFQKGPDYFLEVATKVIPHVKDLVFVVAGSGDMLPGIIDEVKRLSLEEYFLFPGFVQGAELEELFSVADLYVMPSVSEPFGIAALEAISFETPVILSKQSGASEVLQHVLKSDFWDTQRMADLIINALMHRELRDELVANAKEEISRLHWDAAAAKTVEIYEELLPDAVAVSLPR